MMRDAAWTCHVPCWHDGLCVGHSQLDEDHAALHDLVRSLALKDGGLSQDAAVAVFGELLDLAHRHCVREEIELDHNGYLWLEQHRQDHAAGLDRMHKVHELLVRGVIGPRDAGAVAMRWLGSHLDEMDLPARAWLSSSSPE